MKKLAQKLKGFTLIELLVVIAIIGILVAIGTVSYQRSVRVSRDSRRKADLEQIRQALETYRSEIGNYPVTLGWDTVLESGQYITEVPSDPSTYSYDYVSAGTTSYTLCAYLEGGDTSNYCGGGCGGPGDICNYQVTNP